MTEKNDESFDLYYLDDYRNLEEDKETIDKVYVTVIGSDTEITVPKNLWDFMEENGYDPSQIEEYGKFLDDLEEK